MDATMILIRILPTESGTTESGKAWRRCTALFETVEQFPRQVAVSFLNDLVNVIGKYKPGHLLKVRMNAESHEFNGKYYTELRAWNVKPAYEIPREDYQQAQAEQQPATQAAPQYTKQPASQPATQTQPAQQAQTSQPSTQPQYNAAGEQTYFSQPPQ